MTPPGVPQERTAALRQAFAQMMKDPQFLADAKTREVEPDLVPGPELQKMVADNFNTAPALIDKLKAVTAPPR
jgi:tripartite-type tricarboxylate transporter receptor subunit TctC